MNTTILCSGGLDSVALWRLSNCPRPLYVRLNHRYQLREEGALDRLEKSGMSRPRFIDGPDLAMIERADAFIPDRNLLLITLAAAHGYDRIILGALAGETSRDKSERFARDTSHLLTHLHGHPVEVVLPARHLTKTQLVRRYLTQFPRLADRDLLLATRSCYAPRSTCLPDDGPVAGCGQCVACVRRWVALTLNGLTETYLHPPHLAMRSLVRTHRTSWIQAIRRSRPAEAWGLVRTNVEALRAYSIATRGA